MVETNMNDWLVYDTESDGFVEDATKLHVICMQKPATHQVDSYYGKNIDEGLDRLSNAACIVAHNQMKHDIPLIQKLYPGWEPLLVIDTLVLSALLYPERLGGHGIEAWARRFGGEQKVQNEDWSVFTLNMLERCKSDVRLNTKVLLRLLKEAYAPIEGCVFDGFDFGEYNHVPQ